MVITNDDWTMHTHTHTHTHAPTAAAGHVSKSKTQPSDIEIQSRSIYQQQQNSYILQRIMRSTAAAAWWTLVGLPLESCTSGFEQRMSVSIMKSYRYVQECKISNNKPHISITDSKNYKVIDCEVISTATPIFSKFPSSLELYYTMELVEEPVEAR